MKKKVIRIFLLVLMVLLASKIDAHAALLDNVNTEKYTGKFEGFYGDKFTAALFDSNRKIKASLGRPVDKGGEKTYNVNISRSGETVLYKSKGTSITDITVTPVGGQSFYYGDRLHITFTIVLYDEDEFGTVTNTFKGNPTLTPKIEKFEYGLQMADGFVYFLTFPCTFNLKEGDNIITARGGTKNLKEQITIKIPNVKKKEEKRKTLVADSEEEIVSRLKGAKQYRLIVPPNVVPPPQSGTKKIDAKATAAEQIYSTFPEISRLEAKEKIKFKQTSKEDEPEDETLLVDSSGQYISLLGCKVSFIITPEKTRKVDMVGVSGYTDGKASVAWDQKNVFERKRN